MFSALVNAWKIPELRKKILFTLLMIGVFRLGSHIPVPGINKDLLASMFTSDLFTWMNILSGGSFKSLTVFAMGIIPYINASIIVQLLTMVVPYFERLAKEGNEGRKKMTQWIRYGSVVLGALQALVMAFYLQSAMINPGPWSIIVTTIILTAGTAFLMWLGESITENGIGNGISLIIFAGIVSRLPSGLNTLYQYAVSGEVNIFTILLFLLVAVLMIAGIIAVQEAQRRIPVQYSKRVIGRKVYGGQSTHIPFKLNMSGVMSIIFASSLVSMPQMITEFFADQTQGWIVFIQKWFGPRSWVYAIVFFLLIIFFNFFYISISYDPQEIANNLRKNSGSIPGIRPGEPTVQYIKKILNKITLIGAFAVALIAIIPVLVGILFPQVGNLGIGGTTLLFCVGVALDTMKAIESQLMMRHYKGFLE